MAVEQKVEDGFKHLDQKIDEVIKRLDQADNRYAAKWVQQVVGGLIALILTGVLTALLALIIK